jgi:hypothetical protein
LDFFLLTLLTNLIVSGVEYINGVYNTKYGDFNTLYLMFALLLIAPGLIILIFTFKETKKQEKKMQLQYIFYGMSVSAFLFILFQMILPQFMTIEFEGSIILSLPMFGFFAYAITKHKFMKMPKLVLEQDISSEPIEYELEPGYTYIIPEREPKLGFQLFAKALREGAHGICITMQNPNIIRRKYGLKRTPIISISNYEYDDFSVKPEEIANINELLIPYFERPEKSVIFLIDDKTITSGTNLDAHSKILEMSKQFFDTIVNSNSRFIISVSPGSISPKQRKEIIKTKAPLLEFTRLSAFVFEDICNEVLQFLIRNGYIKPEEVRRRLFNLGKKDPFFNKLSYRQSRNPIGTNNKIKITNILVAQRLSKQVLIDKIKLFISEFENIETAMNLNSIAIKSINKYGLSKNEFQLHPGDAYIIQEHIPQRSYEIFSEFVSKDYRGLCITKSNPKKIRRKFAITKKNVKLFWLSDISSPTNQEIIPPKLEHILSAIEEFLDRGKEKKVVLLDGIEYLITYSGDNFDSVLGFLRQVTDKISETNAFIVVPLNPKIVTEERIGLMTRSGMELFKQD